MPRSMLRGRSAQDPRSVLAWWVPDYNGEKSANVQIKSLVEQAQSAEANSVAGFVQYMGTNGYVFEVKRTQAEADRSATL